MFIRKSEEHADGAENAVVNGRKVVVVPEVAIGPNVDMVAVCESIILSQMASYNLLFKGGF